MKLKNILIINLLSCSLAAVSIAAYAADTVTIGTMQPSTTSSSLIPWATNGSSDKVTIENGNGADLSIVINVNDDASNDPAGINVQNCGETTSIKAGSTAICVTSDPKNPITFSSDKEYAATGTYQITQQLPKK